MSTISSRRSTEFAVFFRDMRPPFVRESNRHIFLQYIVSVMLTLLTERLAITKLTSNSKSTIRRPPRVGLIMLKRRDIVLSSKLSFEHVKSCTFSLLERARMMEMSSARDRLFSSVMPILEQL